MIKFKILSFNQSRIITSIFDKKIKLINLKFINKNEMTFSVHSIFKKRVEKLLKDKKIQYEIIKETGMFSFFKKAIVNWGIFAASIIFVLLASVMSQFVLKIEIKGLSKINENEIVEILQKENVKIFSNKNSIDCCLIDKKLLKEFEKISLVSSIIKGQTLVINIKEKLACDEIENLSKFSNAVSNFEGVVRKINLISGTLAVKVGDTIKKGDVLVFPYYVAANGEKVKINPLATFEIDSWVTGVVNHFENRMENVKTGKKFLNQYLCLNNKIVYSKTSTNSFDQFIKETSTQNFSNFLILPFKIRKEIIFETVTKEICEPFETYKNQIYAKAKEIAFKKLDKSAIIKNERTETSFEKGFITVAHIIELSVCFEV